MSPTSQFYAIANLEEAKAYLKDPVLGAHMLKLCQALLELESRDAAAIFGWPDDMKLDVYKRQVMMQGSADILPHSDTECYLSLGFLRDKGQTFR